MKENIGLGKKLHTILTKRNITIWGLAELTGNNVSKVAKWCIDMERPDEYDLAKIASTLKISTTELIRLLEE